MTEQLTQRQRTPRYEIHVSMKTYRHGKDTEFVCTMTCRHCGDVKIKTHKGREEFLAWADGPMPECDHCGGKKNG
ncbi:MAG TPA: hypothetical protein VF077_04005 [Nitrospiraceae bacterium]